MKKKIVFSFILGMIVSGMSVYAVVSLSSEKIRYKDTTVKDSLDNLFDESVSGKTKIAQAITNKGIETLDTDSYDMIIDNIYRLSNKIYTDGYNACVSDSNLSILDSIIGHNYDGIVPVPEGAKYVVVYGSAWTRYDFGCTCDGNLIHSKNDSYETVYGAYRSYLYVYENPTSLNIFSYYEGNVGGDFSVTFLG